MCDIQCMLKYVIDIKYFLLLCLHIKSISVAKHNLTFTCLIIFSIF